MRLQYLEVIDRIYISGLNWALEKTGHRLFITLYALSRIILSAWRSKRRAVGLRGVCFAASGEQIVIQSKSPAVGRWQALGLAVAAILIAAFILLIGNQPARDTVLAPSGSLGQGVPGPIQSGDVRPGPMTTYVAYLPVIQNAVGNPTATPTRTSTPSPTRTGTPIPPTATPTSITLQVAASNDDVNEDGSSFEPAFNTIWLGTAASTSASFTGLRFTNVPLPQGATILSAHLEVFSSQSQWIRIQMSIAAEAADNSLPFSSSNRPSQRPRTNQRVTHDSDVQWQANTWYALDEMAGVIQEVVNRPGWAAGNALAIILQGSGGPYTRKFVVSFDGAAANAPRLVITYTTTTTPTPTRTPTTTPTRTNTPVPPTATPTRTNTPVSPSATPTRTNTPLPPTATPTRTNTPVSPSATPTRTATSTPPPAVDGRFGIRSAAVQLSNDAGRIAQLVYDAGLGWAREPVSWPQIEPSDNAWNWTATDRAISALASQGLSILVNLNQTPLWASSCPDDPDPTRCLPLGIDLPITDPANHYADMLRTIVTRYRGQVRAWQIWNDQNTYAGWHPTPNAADYTRLLRVAYQVIKGIDPAATVVLGGISAARCGSIPYPCIDIDYLDALAAAGAWAYFDASAFRAYMGNAIPEYTWAPYRQRLMDFVTYANQYGVKPLWVTEYGWDTAGVSEDQQASFLVRATMLGVSVAGVEAQMVFALRDSSGYTITYNDYTPRPAYQALRVMAQKVSGATFVRFTNAGSYRVTRFTRDGQTLDVMWAAAANPYTTTVALEGPATITSRDGEVLAIHATVATVTEKPIYVEYDTPTTPTATPTNTSSPAPSPTPTGTNTPLPPTATPTRTNTPAPATATPTRTNTPVPPTATPTRTNTPIPPTATPTRTNTPISATNTPTRTNTPIPPTATPTRTNTPTPSTVTPTRTPTRTPTPTATAGAPSPTPTSPPPGAPGEWTQHAHDAQHTGYTDQVVPTPWRWKWAWNGPDPNGGVIPGKFGLPRNVQPITGGGRVYIAAGSRGVFALSEANGSVLWNTNPGGAINSTPAYDPDTVALFVVSTNGSLYKLNAATGATLAQFPTGASSTLPLPPALWGDRVFFAMGASVYAVNKYTMTQIWSYNAGSPVHTPPAYSPSRNRVVVASQDLYVHAINNTTGSQAWRVKPTVRQPGDPGSSSNYAEVLNGWPVIAEVHGYVLIKLRLDWNTLWTWNPWPTDNATMRSNLQSRPDQQALFALDLDDGSVPFIANLGHGGWGDGGYLPMGPQPAVKRFADGTEVVYTIIRGHTLYDGRWDSHFGEMLLDDTTVPGFQAGYVRFINYDWPMNQPDINEFLLTDEQPFVTMAGDYLFGAHFEFTYPIQVLDRSSNRGSFYNQITSAYLPHLIVKTDTCAFDPSHYCPYPPGLSSSGRNYPAGFYIYNPSAHGIWDQYWSGYAVWVVSNNTVYFRTNDGAIVALEHGNPLGPNQPLRLSPQAKDETRDTIAVEETDIREPKVITHTQARAYAGEVKIVEGRIAEIINNGKAVYLGFQKPHMGALVVRILKEDWDNFGGTPDRQYQVGQVIQVTGRIGWYQGDPAIIVHHPSQIRVKHEP